MAGGKKVGGVKRTRQGKIPAASAAALRKVGGVKNPVPRGASGSVVESCPENCPGEYIDGMWIHSSTCPWAAMLWKHHGATDKQWRCPYDCDPIELSSGWTHPYTCPFWDRTGRTPFDHPKPNDAPVTSAMGGMVSGVAGTDYIPPNDKAAQRYRQSVKEQKERIRRGQSQALNSEEIRRTFEAFPEALRDDDDLPF